MCLTKQIRRRSSFNIDSITSSMPTIESLYGEKVRKPLKHFETRTNACWPSSSALLNIKDKKKRNKIQPIVTSSSAGLIVKRLKMNDTAEKQQQKVKRPYTSLPGLTAKNNVRHFVHHDYHCHANDLPSSTATINLQESLQPYNTKKRSSIETFPRKLFNMLETIESTHSKLKHIVSWQPHGRSFCIHKPKTFATEVIPLFFKQTKLTSFQRQLNLYGFERLTRGADSGGYYHELFLRGREFLIDRMERTKVKGTGYKAASNPDSEPNFYEMHCVQPLETLLMNNKRTLEQSQSATNGNDPFMMWCDRALAKPKRQQVTVLTPKISPVQHRHRSILYAAEPMLPDVTIGKDWHIMADAVFCTQDAAIVSTDTESEEEDSNCTSDDYMDECDLLLMTMPYDSSLDDLSCFDDGSESLSSSVAVTSNTDAPSSYMDTTTSGDDIIRMVVAV